MSAITYAPDLVEEAVLLAERTMDPAEARAFRRERDRLYELSDPDRREADFRALHVRWFTYAGLHRVIEETMAGRADMLDRVAGCRVSLAFTERDESADLIDPPAVMAGAGGTKPTLALRLRPATLLRPRALRALLLHELMHVADMLDPAFAYERTLPPSDDGPSGDNILRDRYRVLWDVVIDGRLARAGQSDGRARAVRAREFAQAFVMLGDRGQEVFDEWFDRVEPAHQRLVAFAHAPNGADSTNAADSGRCPLCRFPVASLDTQTERLSSAVQATIRANHPGWRIEQGLCSQCRDLYEARYDETVGVGR